jgi:hypothetical protein
MLDEKIKLVQDNIDSARQHLQRIEGAMALLEQVGMYPAVPHFQLQERNGSGEYLYLLFRQNHDGSYTGPGGKRKLYIGADPKKQDEARLFTHRRETWEDLRTAKIQLEAWIRMSESKITRLEAEVSHYVNDSRNYPKYELTEGIAL